MKNINYDNALTKLNEEKEIQDIVKGLLEAIDNLNALENNKLLTEDRKILLEAGWWDTAKSYMSRLLGRYKAGGKIFGKGKIDQEAGAKIQKILDKKGNEAIQKLDSEVKAINAKDGRDFPNNQDSDNFLNIILTIATVYDNIVASTKLDPKDQGYLAPDIANAIIADLREYVKKFLDVDLEMVYSVMDSEEDKVDSEKDVLITDSEEEDFDLTQIDKSVKPEPHKKWPDFPLSSGEEEYFEECPECGGKGCDTCDHEGIIPLRDTGEYVKEDKSADVRAQLQAKKGKEEIDSERMKTLKSWRLPLALMGAGASFGALSWLIEYIFPAEKVTTLTPEVVRNVTEEKIGNIKSGEGMTQIMNRVLGTNLSPSSDPDDVVATLSKLGHGNPQTGVDIITQQGGIFKDPELAHKTLTELVKNPHGHGDTLKDVFQGDWAGTGKNAGDTLVTVEGGTLTQMVVKAFIKWTAKTVVKKSIIAVVAGPILKVLGIGLLGAGAIVKLFREKGKRQSRARTLNDLLQSLQFVEGLTVLPEPPEKEKIENEGPKNLCNKNVDQLNELLAKVKERASALRGMKLMNYSDNKMFQKTLLDNFINSKITSIKINGKPISATLKQLYNNGLLEAPLRSRDINKKQQLPQGWENQMSSFFLEVFKLFSLLNQSCKNNPLYNETKKLFKQLYLISTQGQGSYNDDKKRAELFKKLVGSLHNFFSYMSKAKNFTKGSEGKPSEEEIAKRRAAKERGRQRQDKYGETFKDVKPELAHHDRGNSVLEEELKRIKSLMK